VPARVILYGKLSCPRVAPVKALLLRSGVDFDYVGLEWNSTARDEVKSINDGNASVPTLVFPDGTTLTEPSSQQLEEKLEELGYQVQRPSTLDEAALALQHPFLMVLGTVLLALGVSSGEAWMISASVVILGATVLGYAARLLLFRRKA
jgi:mycoredoxin